MSAVAIIQALLKAHAPLTALLPAARVIAGKIPANVPLPAISVSEVDGDEIGTVARLNTASTIKARVQVTVVAESYGAQKALMHAIKLGAGVHRAVVAGYQTLSVLPAGTGPDMNNLDNDGIYEQSRDFLVTFVEPN